MILIRTLKKALKFFKKEKVGTVEIRYNNSNNEVNLKRLEVINPKDKKCIEIMAKYKLTREKAEKYLKISRLYRTTNKFRVKKKLLKRKGKILKANKTKSSRDFTKN